jgi:hypothetical protein
MSKPHPHQKEINDALRYFEPLSRRKLNIFEGQDIHFVPEIYELVAHIDKPQFKFFTWQDVRVEIKNFQFAKGMSYPHFKKMAEICLELEKVGAVYIIEGKLKEQREICPVCGGRGCDRCEWRGYLIIHGRPDITVLWTPEKIPNFSFSQDCAIQSGFHRFHIEVIASEKELKEHKKSSYPFPIICVRI